MRNTNSLTKYTALALLLLGFIVPIRAATLVWTNTAGGDWDNTNNWNPNQLPALADTVFITNSGTYVVTLNVAASIADLTLGGTTGTQTLANNGLTLTLNSPSFVRPNGVFGMDVGAVLAGAGDLLVAGQLNWTGGTMSGSGRTVVTNTGTLTINGFNYVKVLTRNLDLHGAGTFTGTTFSGGNGAVFSVFNGATFDYISDSGMSWTGGGGLPMLQNAGTVRKTGGAGQANVNFILNNSGVVRSQSGDLRFTAGGLSTGNFDATSSASLSFGGGIHTMTNGISFTASGGGSHRCDGGNLNFEVPYTFNPPFSLDIGGTLAGDQNVNFTGLVNWIGGTMAGAGKTIVTNTGTLTINGFNYVKVLTRNLDLRGTGTFTGTTFSGGNGAVFSVFNGATFDYISDSGMSWTGGGGLPMLQNAGTVRKTGGAGQANVNFILNNSGVVRSQSGDLRFTAGGLSTGNFDATSSASLSFGGGIHTMTNGISFTASSGGYHRCDGGNLNFEVAYTFNPPFSLDIGGTLAGNENVNFTGPVNWIGGTMAGAGKTIVTNTGTLTINGFNYAKVLHRNLDLYGTGTFTGTTFGGGQGAVFSVFNGATFDYISDSGMSYSGAGGFATLQNAGTVRKTGGAGQANVNFVLNNSGVMRSQSGDLRFIAGGLSTGNFDATSGASFSFGGGIHTMTNGISFTASSGGYHRCDGGNLEFEVAYTFNPPFSLDVGGTLAGSKNVNFTGPVNWIGGTMAGAGKTIVTNTGTLTINGFNYAKVLHRNLDLHGTGTFTGTTFGGGQGAVFSVFNGATFDYISDSGMSYSGAGAAAMLQNAGTVRKTGGAGQANVNFILNNAGVVRSQSGDLRFIAGGLSIGNFDATSGASFSFGGGIHTMTNGISFTASGGGYHRCDGGNLNFEVAYTFNPPFSLDIGGTLAGNENVNFTGPVNWIGGTMAGAGKTIVTNTGTLTINGFNYAKVLHRNLDLYGTGTFTGTTFGGGQGAVFSVFNGATFDYISDSGMSYSGAGGFATLQNAGTVRKTGGAGQANVNFVLNNSGVMRSQSGDLRFIAGGLSTGNFDATSGASFSFGGGIHTMTNGISFTASGGGYHRCDSGNLEFEVAYTFNPPFSLDIGGTLAGSKNVNFTGPVHWIGGTMAGVGKTIVTNTGTLTIDGFNYAKALHRNLDLYGTGTFTGTTFGGGQSAIFSIFNGATFDYISDSGMSHSGAGALATLQNAGTVRKTGGSGTTSLNLVITNTGTFNSQSGTLNFQNTYRQESGQTLLSGGHYQAVLMDINGGLLSGGGNIAGDVRNNGQVAPGTGVGLMTITNFVPQTYTSTTNALLSFQIGGTTPGTGHDQLRVNSSATVAGTLQATLANGHVPSPGNSYTVMVFSARSGTITNFSFPDYEFSALQTATNIILIALNARPVVSISAPSTQLVCTAAQLLTSVADLDGTVTNLSLYLNTSNLVATYLNPPNGSTQKTLVNFDYPGPVTFSAIATDNAGFTRTASVTTVFYTLPLHVLNLGGKLPDGAFKFCMLGEAGKTYDVLASTNLGTPDWVNIGVMESTNGIWRFTDHNAPNVRTNRYYRARQQ